VPILVAASHGPIGTGFDVPAANGALLAVQQINKAGGFVIGGKHYMLDAHQVELTDAPAAGVAALTTAISQYHPVAVFGPTLSNELTADLVVTNENKVLQFTASTALAPLLGTAQAKYAVKTYDNSELYPADMTFIKKYLPSVKKIAFATSDDSSGTSEIQAVQSAAQSAGLQGKYLLYPEALTDFGSVVQQLKSYSPDFVFAGITPQDITSLMQGLIQEKVGVAYSGTSTDCDFPATNTLGGGSWLCNAIPFDLGHPPTAAAKQYVSDYQAFTGKPVVPSTDFWSLTQYPYVYALVDAMKAAGTVTDTGAIIAKLDGSSGNHVIPYKISSDGNVATYLQIELLGDGGAIKQVENIQP
jgi:branched-chain amino acid transport system substrate-binding protein